MTPEQLEKEKQAFEEWFKAENEKDPDFKWEVEKCDARIGWKAAKEHAAKQGGWISAEEKLPEDDSAVLVYSTFWGIALCAYYDHKDDTWVDFLSDETLAGKFLTHWRPMPEPPEKE